MIFAPTNELMVTTITRPLVRERAIQPAALGPSRRRFLTLSSAFLIAGVRRASAQSDGWFPITSDEGKPVANLRLPVELFSEVDELPGLIRLGSGTPEVTLVEFYDYNCPYCRRAASDLEALLAADHGLQLGLVNNPILSPGSKNAARIELAVLELRGPTLAYQFHKQLYRRPGRIDGTRATAVAAEIGLDAKKVAQVGNGPEVASTLHRQLDLAASLGFAATPSFLIAGAGVLGYPGTKSLARIIASVRSCDAIACPE